MIEDGSIALKKLRDKFAMAAMAGYLAGEKLGTPEWLAKKAYYCADAMLKQRDEKCNDK